MGILSIAPTARLYLLDSLGRPVNLPPAGRRILGVLDQIAREQGDLYVTAAADSHPPTSAHMRGEALDVRTKTLTPERIINLYDRATALLGADFYISYELPSSLAARTPELQKIRTIGASATAEHLHVQLRKGFGLWPAPTLDQGNTVPV